ncbi:MAG: polysaccharide pyruvyl transferase family protein [Acidimicrobiales bacterium]
MAGRKLRADRGHNSQPQDHNQQFGLIDRTYRFDDQLDDTTVASAVVHPATGPLWASDAAVRIRPLLAPALPERFGAGRIPAAAVVRPAPQSVLVVGSGGVRNLGDDATTSTTIRRLRSLLDPSVGIEVITDGPRPSGDYAPGVWLGTVREFANRPLDHHLAVLISGGGTLSQEFPAAGASRQAVAAEAARGGVPVLLSGQGIGPFDRDPAEIRALLGQAVAVSVRDPLSARVAADLGATNVAITGDDATEPGEAPARPDALRLVGDAGWLAFNGRLAGYSEADLGELTAWASAVDEAAGQRGLEVVAVAQNRQPPWEVETLSALAERSRHAAWHVLDVTDDLPLARAVYGLAVGVVARSFHAACFGLAAGVPTLLPAGGGYYRAKADGLAELAGLPSEFSDDAPPADGAEVHRRLAAVAPVVARRPLDGIDAAITAWLVAQLGALGVPLAAGYGANPSASTSPATTVT